MFGGVLSTAIDAAVTPYYTTETFDSNTPASKDANKIALVSFLTLIVIFFILLVVGKTLWNTVLIALFPFVKPAKSVWQILGISILIGLISPGCSCMV